MRILTKIEMYSLTSLDTMFLVCSVTHDILSVHFVIVTMGCQTSKITIEAGRKIALTQVKYGFCKRNRNA